MSATPEIIIVMGSKSDEEKVYPAIEYLQKKGIPFSVHIASAHRTPELVKHIAEVPSARIFIAAAGMAAALPGCLAAITTKPVIGLPLSSKYGLQDSILSMLQMPPGIPVLTVGLDAAKNAAIAACEILALQDENIREKLREERAVMSSKVYEDDETISGNYS